MRLFAIVAALVCIAGCALQGGVSPEQRREQIAAIDNTIAELDTALANARAVLSSPDASAEQRANAEKTVRDAEAARLRLTQLREVTDKAIAEDGTIDAGKAIGAAAPFLPPPFNVIALIGAGLIPGLFAEIRRRRERADKQSIIEAIEAARKASPELVAAMEASKGTILEHMTDGAYEAVKAAKGAA